MDIDGENVPPDGGDGGATKRMTFRDKLMGGATAPAPKVFKDLVDQGKMKVNLVNGNRLLPQVTTDKEVIEEMCAPWRESLIVCLLGKKLGYRTMKVKLANTWRLSGDFDLLDVDNGFYMVKFDMKEDREKVINGGPWMIFDHYLAVSTWSREFVSPVARVTNTLAWVRIPGLNVVFYDESYLLSVARVIGRPIKVDMNTLNADRGRFARICVEIDLSLPVVGKVCIEGYWYQIEYEGLHVICSKCGCYGHRSRECTAPTPVAEKAPDAGTGAGEATAKETPVAEVVTPADGEPGQEQVMEGPTQDVAMAQGENIPSIKDNINAAAANKEIPSLILDAGFEIHGEWLTVVKKKKKLSPRTLERKGGGRIMQIPRE
ncbi:uncharacterized protein LOC130713217 [Lotus japonicus]|uniref:uncharacterized protein LOC130713217 n=1 Tax=Lotus japonicus TaxID=34305 RepID=UPI002585EF18|nr:uncharacterized protein LOC130713217 [Lotus japonicus]